MTEQAFAAWQRHLAHAAVRLGMPPVASAIGAPKEKIRIEPVEVPVPEKTPAPVEAPAETPVKEPVG